MPGILKNMAHSKHRTFEVSNPRKSYAGPTVYRISCKVINQDYQPEVSEEIVVWKRFSEFKKLYKDLSKFYNKQDHSNPFPSLPKATYFDRFDDAVIEQRRKSILKFLDFISDVPQLADHECIDNFLGGGMYTPKWTSSSRTSSFSGSDGDIGELSKPFSSSDSVKESEQGKDSNDEQQGGDLELGGVWLYKQPSLVEGLDTAGNDDNTQDESPNIIQRSLSFDDNRLNDNVEQDSSSSDGDEEEDEEVERTSGWLQRAISLCSEGDDIETLAHEAENSEYIDELSLPKPFSDIENQDDINCSSSESSQLTDGQDSVLLSDSRSKESQNVPSSVKDYEPCRFLPQQPSFDCSVDDYLVAAASIVRDALSFELDGQYKESFHLYKKCVSLLLHGVQGEKDSKRRDAVRRKTAQYLLKAEALYTAYIHESSKAVEEECTQSVTPTSGEVDEFREDNLSTHLQLAEFSVIGAIGKVILVENKSDKANYVIKVLPKTEGHPSRYKSKRSKRRRYFLKGSYSKCPFIVELHQHCETDTAFFLLLEHARGGLVWDHLLPAIHRHDNKSHSYVHNLKETELNKTRTHKHNISNTSHGINGEKRFTLSSSDANTQVSSSLESCIRIWMAEIVLAVAHLHKHGIICRDLNPQNVLLSDRGHVLLTHFGIWNDVNEDLELLSLNLNYCAPELFKVDGLTKAADWWSVGALFYEMLLGETLASQYPWGVRLHTQLQISGRVSAEASSLVKELLVVTPSERLGYGVNGVDDIQSHPFFSGMNWKTLDKENIRQT